MDAARRKPPTGWNGAAEAWRRLGQANHRAWVVWLDELSCEASIRAFEDLSSGIEGLAYERLPKPSPVVLMRIWKEG